MLPDGCAGFPLGYPSRAPDFTIFQDSKHYRANGNGYPDDDGTGTLAGNAVNDEEGVDNSPLPGVSPLQLIDSILNEHTRPSNAATLHNNSTLNHSETLRNDYPSSSTAGNLTRLLSFRPENSSHLDHDRQSHQILAEQRPSFDNSASNSAPIHMLCSMNILIPDT
jgi:hypothetical protein